MTKNVFQNKSSENQSTKEKNEQPTKGFFSNKNTPSEMNTFNKQKEKSGTSSFQFSNTNLLTQNKTEIDGKTVSEKIPMFQNNNSVGVNGFFNSKFLYL